MLGKQHDGESYVDDVQMLRACPACGATARRSGANFCATCGRGLNDDDGYRPADAVRASYHQHRPPHRAAPVVVAAAARVAITNNVRPKMPPAMRVRFKQQAKPLMKNSNGASTTALAFATYALVPYLGILFCPGALVLGGIGLIRSRRALTDDGGRRASLLSITLGVVLLGAQLLLWWILYKVPEWSRQNY